MAAISFSYPSLQINSEIKKNVGIHDDSLQQIVEIPFKNHQQYEIVIRNLNGRLVCDCKKQGVEYKNITLFVTEGLKLTKENLQNPFSLTFDCASKAMLYGKYGLQGGMMKYAVTADDKIELTEIMKKSDVEFANLIKQRLPDRTYTSVTVTSLNFDFSGFTRPTPTRIISLDVSGSECAKGFFYAILAGIGIAGTPDEFKALNKSNLTKELIKHLCNTPEEQTQISNAYTQCTQIHLFISQDLNHLEIRFKNSNTIYYTYRISAGLASTTGLVLAGVGIAFQAWMYFNMGG